jgi:hypothetical protein
LDSFLAHLHVLHHLHLCLSRIHDNPLLYHVGKDGSHQDREKRGLSWDDFAKIYAAARASDMGCYPHTIALHRLDTFEKVQVAHHPQSIKHLQAALSSSRMPAIDL